MSRKKASEQPDLLTFRPITLPSTTHIRQNPQHYSRFRNSQIECRHCTARGTTILPQRPSKILPPPRGSADANPRFASALAAAASARTQVLVPGPQKKTGDTIKLHRQLSNFRSSNRINFAVFEILLIFLLAARQTQIRDSPLLSLRSVGSNSGSRPGSSKKSRRHNEFASPAL